MFADLHYPFLLLMKTNVVAKCVIYELSFIYVDQALRCLQNKSPTFTLGRVGPYDIQVNSLNTLMRDNSIQFKFICIVPFSIQSLQSALQEIKFLQYIYTL